MQMNQQAEPQSLKTSVKWITERLNTMPETIRIILLTVVLGWITHGFVYANTLFGHDNILPYAEAFSAMRWSTPLFFQFRAYLQLPWVIGLTALLELGLVNVLLARMFSLHNLVSQVLLIVTVLVFPSVIAFHNYGAVDLFTGSLLFSVLAAYLLTGKGIGHTLLAIVSLVISIASYQAFVDCTASLVLLMLLAKLTVHEESPKSVLLDALKTLFVIVLSTAIYYIVFRIFSRLTGGAGVTSYRNEDLIGIFSLQQLVNWIQEAYRTLYKYYIGELLNPLPVWSILLQLLCMTIVVCATGIKLCKKGFFKQPIRMLFVLAVLALFPLAINGIQVLNYGIEPHLLMTFAYITPWFIILQYGNWLYESAEKVQKKFSLQKVLVVLCVAIISVNGYYGYILANADYVGRKLNYDASLSLATRLVDRIENVEGYTPETPVLIKGNLWSTYALKPRKGFEMTYKIIGSFSDTGQAMTYNDNLGSTVQWFIATVLSSNMVFLSNDHIAEYRDLDAVIKLLPFPEKDCYTWVDGVLILKLSD